MTDLTRRGLLGAAFSAVVLAPFARGTEAVAAAKKPNLYTRRRFRRLVKAKFRLVGPTGSTPVRLVRIGNLPRTTAGDDRRFTLNFKATKAGPPQGTYTLRRAGFTATTLFVVPTDDARRTYQAVVNRAP